jgi:hypothetical protein
MISLCFTLTGAAVWQRERISCDTACHYCAPCISSCRGSSLTFARKNCSKEYKRKPEILSNSTPFSCLHPSSSSSLDPTRAGFSIVFFYRQHSSPFAPTSVLFCSLVQCSACVPNFLAAGACAATSHVNCFAETYCALSACSTRALTPFDSLGVYSFRRRCVSSRIFRSNFGCLRGIF